MLNANGQFTLTVKLLRVQGETAILITETGQEINWPASQVPAQLASGEMGKLILSSQTLIQEDKDELAKAILNEILTNDEKTSSSQNLSS